MRYDEADLPLFCMLKKILVISGVSIAILLIAGFLLLRRAYQSGALQRVVVDKVTEKIVERMTSSTVGAGAGQAQFIKKMLGFDAPQTFLVLFLNNTELRPGGGFIGSYAIVTIDKAIPHIKKVEGTEILDYSGYPEDFPAVPPEAIKTYLKVPRWYFRDANWSPDFASSAVKALDLYHHERGAEADAITGVIGITATTLEDLLTLLGPITVQGETFTAQNVVDKLEYEVEIAFAQKGVDRSDRKQILADLVKAVAQKMATDVFTHWSDYFTLGQKLLAEKQVLLYSATPADQAVIIAKQWGGTIGAYPGGDYVFWVDSNLGALKTDAVLKRTLSYAITSTASGTQYTGTLTMRYEHQGGRDWRTSRYLTYIRVYTPPGTRIIRTKGIEKNALGIVTTTIDQGIEFGRQWFGGFASINPGTIGEVSFTFAVSPQVTAAIKQGTYYALFPKQIGTRSHALTLNLDFGRRVVQATPGESGTEYGDTRYRIMTDLSVDRYIEVKLSP